MERFILLTLHPAPSLPPLFCTTLNPHISMSLCLGTSAGVVSQLAMFFTSVPVFLSSLHLSGYGSGVISWVQVSSPLGSGVTSEKASVTHQSGSGATSVLRFITEATHRRPAPRHTLLSISDDSSQLCSLVSSAPNTVLSM